MIGCLGPMVGTVVVAVNPPGPSAQMAIAEAAGPCPEDTAFCRERNPPVPTRGDNGLTFKKKKLQRSTLAHILLENLSNGVANLSNGRQSRPVFTWKIIFCIRPVLQHSNGRKKSPATGLQRAI